MPIADRNEQLQPGVPPSAPQFRHIVDALMSQPMARPRLGTGQQPTWGFHEPTVTAGQGVDAALQAAPQVLSDPRNAWFGLGPIAGMARPVQGIRGWMRGREPSRDLGGFSPPVGHLPNQEYLGAVNDTAKQFIDPSAPTRLSANRYLQNAMESMGEPAGSWFGNDVVRTEEGLRQLKAERDLAMFGGGSSGGSIPPRSIMEDLQEKFGFGGELKPWVGPFPRRDTIRGGPPTQEDFDAAKKTKQWPTNE